MFRVVEPICGIQTCIAVWFWGITFEWAWIVSKHGIMPFAVA